MPFSALGLLSGERSVVSREADGGVFFDGVVRTDARRDDDGGIFPFPKVEFEGGMDAAESLLKEREFALVVGAAEGAAARFVAGAVWWVIFLAVTGGSETFT